MLSTDYNLEVERIVSSIKDNDSKIVLLQFPDGLKPVAGEVVKEIESQTSANCLIWFGTCFGACDIPKLNHLNVDLLVQFGHNEFIKEWDDL